MGALHLHLQFNIFKIHISTWKEIKNKNHKERIKYLGTQRNKMLSAIIDVRWKHNLVLQIWKLEIIISLLQALANGRYNIVIYAHPLKHIAFYFCWFLGNTKIRPTDLPIMIQGERARTCQWMMRISLFPIWPWSCLNGRYSLCEHDPGRPTGWG